MREVWPRAFSVGLTLARTLPAVEAIGPGAAIWGPVIGLYWIGRPAGQDQDSLAACHCLISLPNSSAGPEGTM